MKGEGPRYERETIKISYFNKPRRRSIYRRIPRNTPCGYCFEKWATCWDYIIPYSIGGPTDSNNLMPSCRACNGMFHDKVFDSIEEKREYVREHKRSNRTRGIETATLNGIPHSTRVDAVRQSVFIGLPGRCQLCGVKLLTKKQDARSLCNQCNRKGRDRR